MRMRTGDALIYVKNRLAQQGFELVSQSGNKYRLCKKGSKVFCGIFELPQNIEDLDEVAAVKLLNASSASALDAAVRDPSLRERSV